MDMDYNPVTQLYYANNTSELEGLVIHANGWKSTQFSRFMSVILSDTPAMDEYTAFDSVRLPGFRVQDDGTATIDFGKLMTDNPKLRSSVEKAFKDSKIKYLTMEASEGVPFAVIELGRPADKALNAETSPRFAATINRDSDTVYYGETYDPRYYNLQGSYADRITASDASGKEDLTDKIKIDNPVDTKKMADYFVTYTVSDAAGNKASMIHKVYLRPVPPKMGDLTGNNHNTNLIPVDHVNSSERSFDLNIGAEYAGQKVTVFSGPVDKDEESPSWFRNDYTVPDDGILTNKLAWVGEDPTTSYYIVVPWSDPTTFIWDSVTATPIDVNAPEIRDAYDVTVDLGSSFDPREGVSAWDREQGDLTKKITITDTKGQTVSSFDTSKEGLYELNYHVSDGTHDTRWSRVVNVAPAGSEELPPEDKTEALKPKGPVRAGDVLPLIVGKQYAGKSVGVLLYTVGSSTASASPAADAAEPAPASVAGLYAARANGVSRIVLTNSTTVDNQGYAYAYVPSTVAAGTYRVAVTLPDQKLMWNDGLEILAPQDKPAVDKSDLQSQIEAAKKLDPTKYPNVSFQALNDAVKKAEAVLNDPNADQAAVNSALNAVKSAMDAITNSSKPDPGQKVPVTAVTVAGQQSLSVGDTAQLTVKVEPDNAADKTVTWSSSNTAFATVDNTGKVSAKAEGKATIMATANDGSKKSGSLEITVTAKTPSTVDKTTLDKTVKDIEAEKLNGSDYTADSWAAFQSALTAAKALQSNDKATQEQVDAAVKALVAARNGLRKPTPSQPSVPSTPSQPSQPAGPEVVSKPNKLEYRIGEKFDPTGMVVKYQGSTLGSDQYTVALDTSKPGKVKAFVTLNSDPTKATSFEVTVVVSDVQVHRLYNPRNGEHFYVSSENEYNVLVKSGQWRDEGIGFTVADYGTPVYRLYYPGGKHLFTTSEKERDVLIKGKWRYEGIAFYVPEGSKTEVRRLYNPGNGDHLLTTSANERGVLVMHKWRDEGIAFTAK